MLPGIQHHQSWTLYEGEEREEGEQKIGREREEREDTRQRGQRRVGRESGKEEGVTSGTKRRVRKVSPR